jgi:hypothetical protein
MTDYRVYLGKVIDPELDWNELGDAWQRNVEKVQDLDVGMDALLHVTRLIDHGVVRGRQVDWGAWVADVTKQQVLELYPQRAVPADLVRAYRPFMEGKTDEGIAETMNLNPASKLGRLADGDYVLVAIEGI